MPSERGKQSRFRGAEHKQVNNAAHVVADKRCMNTRELKRRDPVVTSLVFGVDVGLCRLRYPHAFSSQQPTCYVRELLALETTPVRTSTFRVELW